MMCLDILKFARLGRVGSGDENQFSFVHRRFCEYFAVKKRMNDDVKIKYDSIPEDSQWRDALVLYCEVAHRGHAQEIAEYCWKTIRIINNPKDSRTIHCLCVS